MVRGLQPAVSKTIWKGLHNDRVRRDGKADVAAAIQQHKHPVRVDGRSFAATRVIRSPRRRGRISVQRLLCRQVLQDSNSRTPQRKVYDFHPSSSRYPQPKAPLRNSCHPGGYVHVGVPAIHVGLPAIGDEPLFHPRLALRATQIEIGQDLAPSCMNHISSSLVVRVLSRVQTC
jgi:hypothetical protein